MTDRYQVLQPNDGTSGIPQGVTFLKIPNTPCQNLHLKCQPNVGRFLKEFD
jgi:hypothetical protein